MPQPGTLIEGKYEILGKIREGGMGSIYKVRHKLLDEIRVVKVMRPEMVGDEELRRRFVEEAKTATRLKHPHIGAIYDFALDEDGTAYLVMEFIEGVNLAELMLSGHPPNLSLSLEIAHQALLALSYLHRKNIVHRDVAPDNLMLTHDENGRPHVKLIDLGIAKAVDKDQQVTSTGVFLGKLKYASPELFGSLPPGEKIDGRSDLYSLGVVLYKLLTGARPFPGDAPAELLRAHLFLPPTPFEQTDPEGRVPREVRAVTLRALQKKREHRFASADEFDREIVSLRRQYAAPEDLEGTQAMVSSARHTRDSWAATVTPSAQDRLDRQFIAQATPYPVRPTHTVDTIETKEIEKAVLEPRGAPPAAPVESAPAGPRRSRTIAVSAAIVLAAIVAAAALLLRNRSGRETAAARAATAPPVPTAFVQGQPTAAAEPTVAPTSAPAQVPVSPPPAPSLTEESAPRRAVEEARTRAARSRSAAERTRAPEFAAEAFASAAVKQREAQGHLERRNWAAAKAAFEHAATLFEGAQIRAEAARREALRPSPVVVAAAAAPTARPEPTRAPPAPAAALTAEPQKPPPTSPPAEAARPAATEQDRIREAIRRYERALSTLDADLYATVYPSVDRDKIRANFQSLRSQTLEFTIQKIEIASGGTSASVRGYEKRSAAPRIGSEQHFNGDRVIHLEKRGDSWVIVNVS